jgi:Fis family transcriptional regulator, factor for inversion stimulation protein
MSETDVAACVHRALKKYFKDLDGEEAAGLYNMVVNCVERPLIEMVLKQAGGNQTRAAEWLGINRNTLRKKMAQHKIK